MSESTEQIAEL